MEKSRKPSSKKEDSIKEPNKRCPDFVGDVIKKLRKLFDNYKVAVVAFTVMPAILVSAGVGLPTAEPTQYLDKEISFSHVTTYVNVFFDGQKSSYYTQGVTIKDALAEGKIPMSEFDISFPSLETKLSGQETDIFVKRARPVVIIDGGKEIRTFSAYDTASDILEHLGIKVWDEDKVEVLTPIGEVDLAPRIVIDRAPAITVLVDGQNKEVHTRLKSVGEVLNKLSIKLGPADTVSPQADAAVTPGMTITVCRIVEETITENVSIPYDIQYIDDASMNQGTEQVLEAGVFGQKEQTAHVVRQNGVEISRVVLAEKLISPPKTAVVKRGTRPVFPSMSGTATWYGPGFVGKNTASGQPFDPCRLAAAHKTLPLGTMVKVTNLRTGLSVVVVINDRGPYSGHIIDLTWAAKSAIGMESTAPVRLEVL